MNLTADRKELANAVKTAFKAASKLKEVAVMTGVLLEANADKGVLTVTGTDGTVQIQCRVPCNHIEDGGALVLTPVAAGMLRLLPGETVEIRGDTVQQGSLILKAGHCEYALPVYPAKDFPKLSVKYPTSFIQGKGVNTLIRRVGFAAGSQSESEQRRGLQNVKLIFEEGCITAAATNGMIAALVKSQQGSDGTMSLILPGKVLHLLSETVDANDDLYIGTEGRHVFFMSESMIFTTVLQGEESFDVRKVFERIQPVYRATTDAKEFSALIENTTAILREKDDSCVTVTVETEKITATTKTATGTAAASVQATQTIPPKKEYHYNPKWLLSCLRAASGPVTLLWDEVGCLILEANHNRYCVLPRGPAVIRLPEPKAKKEKKTKKAA